MRELTVGLLSFLLVFAAACSKQSPRPDTPSTPSGPDTGHVNYPFVFATSTTAPRGDSIRYQFDWDDGDRTWSGWCASGETAQLSHSWSSPGTHGVRVKAQNRDSLESAWSSAHTIVILSGPGTLKWRYQTGGAINGSPAIAADGTVYVASDDSYFYALNADGTLRWRYKTGAGISSSPAIGEGEVVYVASNDSFLYALSPDGTLGWRYHEANRCEGRSPAIGADGTVYIIDHDVGGSYGRCLLALNTDGTLRWNNLEYGSSEFASPVVAANGTVYAPACRSSSGGPFYLCAVDPGGSPKWRCSVDGYICETPAVAADGTIYVLDGYNYLYAIAPDGSLKWRFQTGDFCSSPTIAADGTVYFGTDESPVGCLYAVNPDGSLKWRYQMPQMSLGYPSAAVASDGTVYFGNTDGELYALNADGTLRWRYQAGGVINSPAIAADGTIYFGCSDGSIYAVEGSAGLASVQWPKFQHDNQNTGCAGGP
ncbi:MAG: PQQ-binding-like beta-propeller repeat protein [candidate division WOR-3 bacterium]|nr:PQQ-binding-like beta-propeller repeat protein [candidate division WOR-3 bacterium]